MKLWAPVLAYTGLIFWISSEPRPIPGIEFFPQMDKVCHFTEFLPYGMLWLRAWRRTWGRAGWKQVWGAALLAAATVGALDEWYQSFVPGKVPDVFDWSADLFGALMGQALYRLKTRRLSPRL